MVRVSVPFRSLVMYLILDMERPPGTLKFVRSVASLRLSGLPSGMLDQKLEGTE